MQDSAHTSLSLLAPDGIVRVTFGRSPNEDQCLALLNVSRTAKTVDELAQGLEDLGHTWGVSTVTEIVSRTMRVVVRAPDRSASQSGFLDAVNSIENGPSSSDSP